MNADDACNTLSCPELATKLAHWPGSTKSFCDGCAERAKGIAEAMGFKLTIATLDRPDLGEALARQTLADDDTVWKRAPYEPPAIERTIELDGTACRECGSDIGFCAPACSSQGRD
jgi:hypothetical protein